MRSPHRVDIKAIIDELGRQAVHLQEQRLALIDEIRADPSYNVCIFRVLSSLCLMSISARRAQCPADPRRRVVLPARPQLLSASPVPALCDRPESHAARSRR